MKDSQKSNCQLSGSESQWETGKSHEATWEPNPRGHSEPNPRGRQEPNPRGHQEPNPRGRQEPNPWGRQEPDPLVTI